MHVMLKLRTTVLVRGRSAVWAALVSALILATAGLTGTAHASAPAAVDALDSKALGDLEQHASTANVREQAFLYADLADKMSLLAGKQFANGEDEAAEATLQRLEACTAKMEINFKNSKSLKKTELLLHNTNRRLSDMVRATGMDAKPHVQAALKRLNAAQTSLLAIIFEK